MGDHVNRDGGRWGERTIRNGKIRWLGDYYAPAPDTPSPCDQPGFVALGEYAGQLDGLRGVFYTYGNIEHFPALKDKVFLHSFNDEWPGPNCIDGYIRWETWVKVNDEQSE